MCRKVLFLLQFCHVGIHKVATIVLINSAHVLWIFRTLITEKTTHYLWEYHCTNLLYVLCFCSFCLHKVVTLLSKRLITHYRKDNHGQFFFPHTHYRKDNHGQFFFPHSLLKRLITFLLQSSLQETILFIAVLLCWST